MKLAAWVQETGSKNHIPVIPPVKDNDHHFCEMQEERWDRVLHPSHCTRSQTQILHLKKMVTWCSDGASHDRHDTSRLSTRSIQPGRAWTGEKRKCALLNLANLQKRSRSMFVFSPPEEYCLYESAAYVWWQSCEITLVHRFQVTQTWLYLKLLQRILTMRAHDVWTQNFVEKLFL